MLRLIRFILLLLLTASVTAAANDPEPSSMLLDATWVPCSDSTEAMFIFNDGRVIYAAGDRGTIFTISGALLNDLRSAVADARSTVDTKFLDSCTTLGVILDGPRYLLINNRKPTAETSNLHGRLDRLRRFAQRKLDKAMEKLTNQVAEAVEAEAPQPTIPPGEFRRHLRLTPVASEWRCRGTIIVAIKVGWTGEVRDAYIHTTRVRGKCTPLLAVAAMRAALMTKFEPAVNEDGTQKSGWVFVEVPFERK